VRVAKQERRSRTGVNVKAFDASECEKSKIAKSVRS
jgi:hypothetical protein